MWAKIEKNIVLIFKIKSYKITLWLPGRRNKNLAYLQIMSKKIFGILRIPFIPLHQFFIYHLSRKAEGNGPMKP
jgi:hypothetical protein